MNRVSAFKQQALRWLTQREHSRHELQIKLAQWAARDARAGRLAPAGKARSAPRGLSVDGVDEPIDAADEAAAVTDAIVAALDQLQAAGWLSAERFVDSRLHLRQARFGNRRILAELKQHGHAPSAEQQAALVQSETQRAADLLRKRFGASSAEPNGSTDDDESGFSAALRDRQRRQRFLLARGFSPASIAAALRLSDDERHASDDASLDEADNRAC